MRVFNKDKTQELKEYDLNLGYLIDDKIITYHEAEIVHHEAEITHHDAVKGIEEQGHYEVVAEYPNGGRDVKWVVDLEGVEAREAYDEVIKEAYDEVVKEAYDGAEDIEVYIPYTEEELLQNKISKLKKELYDTDYKAIKYAEGWFSDEEYAPIKEYRESIRVQIRELEESSINNA